MMPDCASMSINGLQYLYTVSRVNLAFDVLYLLRWYLMVVFALVLLQF